MKQITPRVNPKCLLLAIWTMALLALAWPASPAHAGGAVDVCDEAHLRTALSGGGTVTFSCSGYITLANTLTISMNTTINGSGQSVTISGSRVLRVFNVKSGVTLSLIGLTIRQGNDTSSLGGGAVLANGGNVSINNCLITDSSAMFGGGVMVYDGTLTVANSTFSGNSGSIGGAITGYDATMTVSNSTFSMNDAPRSAAAAGSGGAIYAEGGTLTVSNSTIHRNSADSSGGGIAGDNAAITVINSTFFNNTAGLEGNSLERSGSGSMTLKNTILYNNLPGSNCGGSITDGGNNLSYSDSTCPGVHRNPLLQTLNSNGGPTFTMLLGPGSPAIDAGNDIVCAAPPVNNRDQRGVVRPQGAHCDIGAVEQHPYSTANVRKVPDDYSTIQEAVDAAAEGDEIWVAAGDYAENLSITKGIALVGGWDLDFGVRTPGDSIIDGGGASRAISITCSTNDTVVTIDGFTIENGDATGLGPLGLAELPASATGLEQIRPGGAAPAPDLLDPSQQMATLQAGLADLAARGLYPGGSAAYQATLERLGRFTLKAEEARARAQAAPARLRASSQQGAGSGGGIYSENSSLQLLNSTVMGNIGSQDTLGIGGGAFVTGAAPGGVRIAGNRFRENIGCAFGDGWGGGLYVLNAPEAIISDNVFEQNLASSEGNGYGGGLFVYKSAGVAIRGNNFEENLASDAGMLNEGVAGGLAVHTSPEAVVQDNLVEHNTANASWNAYTGVGGGILVTYCDGAMVGSNEIRENLAGLRNEGIGGGVQFVFSARALVADNEVIGNVAGFYCGQGEGGGIKAAKVFSTTVSGNEIRENAACVIGDFAGSLGHFGGGFAGERFDGSLLIDNVITHNATCFYCGDGGGFGGGAFLSTSQDAQVVGNTFDGNAGALLDGGGYGGGLLVRDTTGSQLLRNRIQGNRAGMAGGSLGGGLVVESFTQPSYGAVLDGNLILDNRAGGNATAGSTGGGCRVTRVFGGVSFTNNVVAGNRADEGGGVLLESLPQGATVVNNTIANNGDLGLGILGSGTAVIITNNIVVSHSVGIDVGAGTAATVSYTLWNGNTTNTAGAGTIHETHPVTGVPAFLDPAANDYHLTITSAAREAGDPTGVPPAPDRDADGTPRPQGAAVDIGAYEWEGYWLLLPVVTK